MIDEPVTTAAAASDLLSKLVAIPSVAPDVPGGTGESAMAEAVEAFARDVGATVACCEALPGRSNVVATLPGAAARPALMLEAHMDTVALGPMTNGHHPWVDALGRLHGRGACDTKGALAAMLLALQWAAHQPQRPCTLVLAAAVDEETGGHGARALARSGPPADAAIVGEPTGLTIVRAHRGVVIWTLVTAGAAAHSSTPERGHNAIYDMCEVVGILRAEYAGRLAGRSHPLTGPSTFSAGVIRAGTSFNIIPDRCELVIERRNIPGESLSAVEAELEDVLEVVRTRLPHARVALAASEVLAASLHTPPEAPIV
ncbi:MAG: M20/M25/M40 family metallo-hydrolase, partial [Actinobacteria bacterium]|nr:M20/M25/M40 family metallo-hydrolase [Actinomycetota bacterium]